MVTALKLLARWSSTRHVDGQVLKKIALFSIYILLNKLFFFSRPYSPISMAIFQILTKRQSELDS